MLTRMLLSLVLAGAQAADAGFDQTHASWGKLLEMHVAKGGVDYPGMKQDAKDLAAYLASLESVSKERFEGWGEPDRIAFLVNAYNAYTVKLVVDHYPVKSIKDLGGYFSSVFKKEFIPLKKIYGRVVSLNEIEHETLRKKYKEPRIHFALVCASKSCPALRSEAYRGKDLDAQLDDQARRFLGDSTKNRFDPETKTLHLSKIFDWFGEDFEKNGGSVQAFVGKYLKFPPEPDIEYLDYDWSLNEK